MMFTIPRSKWIWTRFTITGSASRRVMHSNDCDAAGTRDDTLTLSDGDLVLIKDGYHPVVAAHGYDVYYLNVLAGSARSMAASDDSRYAHLRNTGLERDPRVPLVHAP